MLLSSMWSFWLYDKQTEQRARLVKIFARGHLALYLLLFFFIKLQSIRIHFSLQRNCFYRFQWCDLTKAPYLKTKYFLFGVSSQIRLRKTDSIHNTIHSQSYKMLGQTARSRARTLFVLLVERIRLFYFIFFK